MQRQVEAAGISTLSLSNIAEVTQSVGVPRLAAIEHPGSQPMGPAGDRQTQNQVLQAALSTLVEIDQPGGRVDLPFVWPKGVTKALKAQALPPIIKMLMKKPWMLGKLVSGRIPRSERV